MASNWTVTNENIDDVHCGSYYQYDFTVTNKAGTPIDITGHTFLMKVRDKIGGNLFLSTENEVTELNATGQEIGVTITDAANGEAKFSIAAANTTKLQENLFTTGWYTLQRNDGAAQWTEMHGQFRVTWEATN